MKVCTTAGAMAVLTVAVLKTMVLRVLSSQCRARCWVDLGAVEDGAVFVERYCKHSEGYQEQRKTVAISVLKIRH